MTESEAHSCLTARLNEAERDLAEAYKAIYALIARQKHLQKVLADTLLKANEFREWLYNASK